MRIAYVGNHRAEYSTESDLRRTLESMGHEVVALHEPEWLGQVPDDVAMLLQTHTKGWGPAPDRVSSALDECRRRGIPSVGYHLDLWRGLPRAADVLHEPFFRCSLVFTADGGTDGWWRERGVNHVWSPPGVLEASCYLAEPVEELRTDVIFVGARGYHPEYPFRRSLVEWVEREYGARAKVYEHSSGMRGHRLNQLYASARVVVGDSCFAGELPRYWSDRLPETLGRGGRLVFPRVDGLPEDTPCRLVRAQWLEAMRDGIADALATPDDLALIERERAVSWAKAGHTYRHRMQAMLDTLRERGLLHE